MPKKHQGPQDFAEIAFRVFQEAFGEAPHKDESATNPAVRLGRKGGLKGGKARAAKLTPDRRSEIAKEAAVKRWSRD
ncbi:MAG: histone H1 [Armatimonadetes bacterium]|nr:histone H1 [Armatimonadota bacterium]